MFPARKSDWSVLNDGARLPAAYSRLGNGLWQAALLRAAAVVRARPAANRT